MMNRKLIFTLMRFPSWSTQFTKLVSEFESYCLFATHSPLVIREIPSKSVFVVDRDEDIPTVRKIGQESFGGNVASLIDEVFGNRSVIKSHEIIIDKLIEKQFDYDMILAILRSDEYRLL